jgi:hypothetical protein
MQKADPKRPFVECWNQLRREQAGFVPGKPGRQTKGSFRVTS